MSDRLGSAVNARLARCGTTCLRGGLRITGLSDPHFEPFLAVLAFSELFSSMQHPFFFPSPFSPLTHEDDPCRRLAMMMSPAALEGLPREGSFVR